MKGEGSGRKSNATENNKCHLASCRYNRNGGCQNKDKQKECVEVVRLVLCLDGREDGA